MHDEPTILLASAVAASALDELRSQVSLPCRWIAATEDDLGPFQAALPTADILITNKFLPAWAPFAGRLRLLQLNSAGYDAVAFDALPAGCRVANVFGHERAIAEMVILQLLALTRRLLPRDRALREGRWLSDGFDDELAGKTLAILGFGSVGRAVGALARAFDMRVAATKRRPDPELARRAGLDFLGGSGDLPRLLAEADALVVAIPLDEQTRGLIGARELAMMKRGAYLLNIARGPIVDEAALYRALSTGQLGGAALDVWYRYPDGAGPTPPATLPFHALDNVVMTPHIAGVTTGTFRRRWQMAAANIERFLKGEPLANQIYPSA
ncbi:MAG: hypothetical protein IT305_29060 [Chloroflexi bacterium]|nr:hypothetical protein [Chloroflexota bacterium]